ncbi:MAG: hypothetical protein M1820_005648 [Bogoriella megaspora]|nr:MAG: hypothetical protein M1820_005648 [Bogoriella megaspora]
MAGKLANLSFLSLLLTSLVSSTPHYKSQYVPSSHAVHEKRGETGKRWSKGARIHPRSVLPMRIGLAQSNLDNAHVHLMDVSNPASPNYAKYWSQEDVINAFQPSEETKAAVREWLVNNGIEDFRITHSDNKGWYAFDATNEEAERLLHTEFYEFEDWDTGKKLPACDQYHVPKDIQHHVDYITPGIKLLAPKGHKGEMKKKRAAERDALKRSSLPGGSPRPFKLAQGPIASDPSSLATCDSIITPACVAALYQIPKAGTSVSPNNSLGIFEAEDQFWVQSDLNLFFANFTTTNVTNTIPNGTHPINVSVDGGIASSNNSNEAGTEAELDLELAYPIIYPQTITLYAVDDTNVSDNITEFGFNTFLDALDGSYCTYSAFGITGNSNTDPVYPDPKPGGYTGQLQCGTYTPTNVISVSYGEEEADIAIAYQKRQCNEFMKLGLQGVSILFASGDSGVSGRAGCLGPQEKVFNPTWPNTCPYLTNVGATKVYPGKTVFDPESAANDPQYPYSSGGGFSNLYAIPDYQKDALNTYFSDHAPSYPYYSSLANSSGTITSTTHLLNVTTDLDTGNGIYNRIGRGVPDVSANGDNIATDTFNRFGTNGGTSASAPIFASIINRIIEERIAAGKGPLGFLNPALYQNPSMFNDITNGTNPGCGTQGFSAVEGWDPVTGLGTPNYPKMRDYFLNLS